MWATVQCCKLLRGQGLVWQRILRLNRQCIDSATQIGKTFVWFLMRPRSSPIHEPKLLVNQSTEEAQVELSIAGMVNTIKMCSVSQHTYAMKT